MSEPLARGYIISRTVDFIQGGYFTPEQSQRIMANIPSDVRVHYDNLSAAEWYPRSYIVPLMRGIASVKNDDVGSAEDLAAYGRAIATYATNTFLRLLMKMMTPTLFLRKVPGFYQRDHQGSGHFEVDTTDSKDGKIVVRLIGAEGFDHMGAATVGFFQFGVEAISGPGSVDVVMAGWSMSTPSPPEVTYKITLR